MKSSRSHRPSRGRTPIAAVNHHRKSPPAVSPRHSPSDLPASPICTPHTRSPEVLLRVQVAGLGFLQCTRPKPPAPPVHICPHAPARPLAVTHARRRRCSHSARRASFESRLQKSRTSLKTATSVATPSLCSSARSQINLVRANSCASLLSSRPSQSTSAAKERSPAKEPNCVRPSFRSPFCSPRLARVSPSQPTRLTVEARVQPISSPRLHLVQPACGPSEARTSSPIATHLPAPTQFLSRGPQPASHAQFVVGRSSGAQPPHIRPSEPPVGPAAAAAILSCPMTHFLTKP
ncbi:hypothetical protein STAS_15878 [Striga asiatica]|uniref:Uncharacterized protein n=1 Tax=Striga asiatica TaxID=4170 RepID=A0A5A7Q2D0_STRAF|nr:hypothetical protein STAS_15878 [Striga asiatica]